MKTTVDPVPVIAAGSGRLEVLAPAGGPAAFAAALEAGADAIYCGLRQLNARRGAENFQPEELTAWTARAHAAGARVYLTLNIDVAQRELGQAARQLVLARQAGVDAVLVRDPAFLALRPLFPELEFHFSTQAGVSSSAGVRAAGRLGLRRVVLARELGLAEIRACAAVPGVEVEVFVQGALCFSASGRCLLSSWVGGRSGNRGACASPCRVPYAAGGAPPARHLSMLDLCLVERLPELAAAGVRALKIEGRLKNAAWVTAAVRLYRTALVADAAAPVPRADDAGFLGAYAGRGFTDGYLTGRRDALTGDSARPAGQSEPGDDAPPSTGTVAAESAAPPAPAGWVLSVRADERGGLLWRATWNEQACELRTPPRPVRRADRAVTLQALEERLVKTPLQEVPLARFVCEAAPETALAPTAAKALLRDLSAFLHRVRKAPDATLRGELPETVRTLLAPPAPHPDNRRILGDMPDRVRLEAERAAAFMAAVPEVTVIVELASIEEVVALAGQFGAGRLVVALPAVFYEADLPRWRAVAAGAAAAGVTIEVNSWDGWEVARDSGARLEAGPGLMVLNALAAGTLANLGLLGVTASLEADRGQLEALAAACPAPLSVTVYGRPALLSSRAEVPAAAGGAVLADVRGVRLHARSEGAVTAYRPETPFNWSGLRNPRVRMAHGVADLVAAPDPLAAWRELGRLNPAHSAFNYARELA
jgi:putative protease